MSDIYYLGGSPCAGKSTIAEKISERYGFQYYKVDDFLAEFIASGGELGDKWLKHISEMSLDQFWLRDPVTLNEEALFTYEKLFPDFVRALEKLDKNTPVITEGAAFLPGLVNKLGVDKAHYVCMVPSKEFQIHHFKKRLPVWINDYLSSCSDKEKAFDNWMERDVLFASTVLKQAEEIGYSTLIVDGSVSVEESFQFVVNTFGL
ncbi:MAG: AAA family ATPase [Oscillospiraceae bacterium]|jgi:dephospho-CoA kinase|nr:AAA family ATPase [Oscillospiraceae bacterium]